MHDIESLLARARAELSAAVDLAQLDAVRVRYLGKKGELTAQLKQLGGLPDAERRAAGQVINTARDALENELNERRSVFEAEALRAALAADAVDVSLPGRGQQAGGLHPVTQTLQRIEAIFAAAGFSVSEGPEVEDDFHNFTALNIPEDHPARAMHDTFYLPSGKLLRTHTSPVQIRTMLEQGAPLRLIAPGRVYRCDSDMTHTPMFHQVEGLVVDSRGEFRQPEGDPARVHRALFRASRHAAFPALVLSLHRAVGGSRCAFRIGTLAGSARLRHGASEGARQCRHRRGEIHRLCLRHGRRAPGDAQVRHRRYPSAV
jgi:phenylalanyl-tRNA synthetase alpha chain